MAANKTSFRKGKDSRRGKGGKRPGAGAPTKDELRQRVAEVKGLEKAKDRVEQKLAEHADKIAERYVTRAVQDKADSVLIDAVRKILPEPKQQGEQGPCHNVTIITIDANAERRQKRLKGLGD